MNKKRILAGVCLTAVTLASLCGCGNKNTAQNSDIPTILWYIPDSTQAGVGAVLEEANKIVEKEVGAKLDLQFVDPGAFSEKMQLAMAASEKFDLCFTGYINPHKVAIERGGFAKLDEYLDKMPKLKDSLPEYAWASATVNGSVYAVPNAQFWGWGLHAYTFKDLAEKYDFDYENAKTVDDLIPYLQKIKDNEPDMYPLGSEFIIESFITDEKWEAITSGIHATFDDDGNATFNAVTDLPYWRKAHERAYDWYKKGYLRKDIASVTDDTSDYTAQRYGVWYHNYQPGVLATNKAKYNRETVKIQLQDFVLRGNTPSATMTAVSQNSSNKEKAVKIIELANTNKEFYNLISFGVEGKNYEKLEGNYIKPIENSGYSVANWKVGSTYNSFLTQGMEEGTYEESKTLNNTTPMLPTAGFSFDTSVVQNEIAQIDSVIGEYSAMMTGATDPKEYWDSYCKKLKDAGVEKVRDEVEKQYRAWEKSNNK